ncbi:MAG: chromophore lyase CpcT/CpeT [Acidobacteria bacterium]|nr:chromophore lyase CpcT/CpeT [Acidobacteriota bacterium]MCG3195165.1 Chromophore lyase CpcT/CpeT [Thermoanaerobaculia bacterium]MCK6680789.1 chromophore lyase CpcT/CpeT [Thermoanaerobaculia bacterium]
MKLKTLIPGIVLAAFTVPALAQNPPLTKIPSVSGNTLKKDAEIKKLTGWMTGSFDTFAQVAADEKAKKAYTHMKAVMNLVPIDVEGLSGQAFYLEQAAADSLDKPYRQRVYLLTRQDGKLVNRIYKFKDPAPFTGAFAEPKKLASLTLDEIVLEEGCDVAWTKVNDTLYKGIAGANKSCKSAWKGGATAVSKIELTPGSITSLDQGYDEAGKLVWGPPEGNPGHIFKKKSTKK